MKFMVASRCDVLYLLLGHRLPLTADCLTTVVTKCSTVNQKRKEWQNLFIANLRTIYSVCMCGCVCGWETGCVQKHVLYESVQCCEE